MRKSLLFSICAVLFSLFSASSLVAEEREYKYPYQESQMTYRNVTIYKILEQKDAYIVMYSKGHREIGSIDIPKKWYDQSPKKLQFRPLQKGMSSYMTVFYRNGEFSHVVLTVPVSRDAAVWGVADSNVSVNPDKETLDIVY